MLSSICRGQRLDDIGLSALRWYLPACPHLQVSKEYPIRVVSRMTGISVDTLRAWERRYHVVTPDRSPRGRLYNESHVQRFLQLRDAVASGYAIGQVAALS